MPYVRPARSALAVIVIALAGSGCAIKPPDIPPAPKPLEGTNDAPLVIDWQSDQRGNLGIAMTHGIAVLAYANGEMRVLDQCRIEGTYGLDEFSIKEDVVQYKTSEDIKANLPLGGAFLAAKLGGELARGASVDVALVMVGKRSTTLSVARPSEVQGPADACKDATHFVRAAYLGAFAMQLGSNTSGLAAADVFAGHASWQSQVAQMVRHTDGNLKDCESRSTTDGKLDENCAAVLKLELGRVADPGAVGPTAELADVGAAACPVGFVRSGGSCVSARGAASHECRQGDWDDCDAQCKVGNAASCATLAFMYHYDTSGKRDFERAASLYRKACDGGSQTACAGVGMLYLRGLTVTRDFAQAAKLFDAACQSGSGRACNNLGFMFDRGLGMPRGPRKGAQLQGRGCDAGYALSCNNVGWSYEYGDGVDRDLARAETLFKRACDGNESTGCRNLGDMYLDRRVKAPDPGKGESLLAKACDLGNGGACDDLAERYAKGDGTAKNDDWAATRFVDAARSYAIECDEGDGSSCDSLAFLYGNGKGIGKDANKALGLLQRAEATDYPDGYADEGKAHAYGWWGLDKDPKTAEGLLSKGCDAGSGSACDALASFEDSADRREDDDADDDQVEKRVTALYQKACDAKYADGCNHLAERYHLGNGVDRDDKRWADLYTQSCTQLANPSACVSVGVIYEQGWLGDKAPDKANGWYERGCALDDARGCYFQGMNLVLGIGITADVGKGAQLYQHACDLGEGDACDRLAKLYVEGKVPGRDATQALALYKKGCDEGRVASCNSLGVLYENGGPGITADPMQAALCFRKSCDGKSGAGCENLADLYFDGRGVGRDTQKAREYYEGGCDRDSGRACRMAVKVGLASDPSPSNGQLEDNLDLLGRACSRHDGEGCEMLGEILDTGKGTAVKKEPKVALVHFTEACMYGIGEGCARIGAALEAGVLVSRNVARAVDLYREGCKKGSGRACARMATFASTGTGGVDRDPDAARALAERACALGVKTSCRAGQHPIASH